MEPRALAPESVAWQPELPGAEYAILSGDPGAAGVFRLGFGERFDAGGLREYEEGSYLAVPKQVRHFVLYEDGTVVQVHGAGPFQSIYVNPEEDLGDRIPGAGWK